MRKSMCGGQYLRLEGLFRINWQLQTEKDLSDFLWAFGLAMLASLRRHLMLTMALDRFKLAWSLANHFLAFFYAYKAL
jgi:hypothetical protein